MRYQIKRIAPLQAGRIMAAYMLCIALVFCLIFGAVVAISPFIIPIAPDAESFHPLSLVPMVLVIIFMPILYSLAGFIFGMLGATIYNVASRFLGGLELELEAVPLPPASNPPP